MPHPVSRTCEPPKIRQLRRESVPKFLVLVREKTNNVLAEEHRLPRVGHIQRGGLSQLARQILEKAPETLGAGPDTVGLRRRCHLRTKARAQVVPETAPQL